MAKNQTTTPNFQAAADRFAVGEITSAEAADVAFEFQNSRAYGPGSEGPSPKKLEHDSQPTPQDGFNELYGPHLQLSAKSSIMALAQGLLRAGADPLADIYNVGRFVSSVSDLLSEPEFERAQIFGLLGNEETQLPYYDKLTIAAEAALLRQRIRQAATEYVNNPLNKDPEP